MDRQTVFGFILIAIVLMVWMWWSSPRPSQQVLNGKQIEELKKDSSLAAKPLPEKKPVEIKTEPQTTFAKRFSGQIFFSRRHRKRTHHHR